MSARNKNTFNYPPCTNWFQVAGSFSGAAAMEYVREGLISVPIWINRFEQIDNFITVLNRESGIMYIYIRNTYAYSIALDCIRVV